MNNKLNYKKRYKNEILRLIYMCGLIPYRSLRILAAEPRMYQRAIRKMEEDGIVAIDKKGGEKNIRLLSKRERRKDYEYLLPPEYIEYYENTIAETVKIREFTKSELIKRGFTVTDSKTNFVFAKTDKIPSSELYEELRNRGILIRYFNAPRISEYFRMSMGTMEQMKKVIEVIDEIIKERE